MSGFIHEEPPVVPEVPATIIEKPDEVLAVLEEGLARIRKGWTQVHEHEERNHQDYYCALGAIRYQRNNHSVKMQAEEALGWALPPRWRSDPVWAYNDALLFPGRGKRRIIRLYKRAIKRRKEGLKS